MPKIVVQGKQVVYHLENKPKGQSAYYVKVHDVVYVNGDKTSLKSLLGTYIHERIMRDVDNNINHKVATLKDVHGRLKVLLEKRCKLHDDQKDLLDDLISILRVKTTTEDYINYLFNSSDDYNFKFYMINFEEYLGQSLQEEYAKKLSEEYNKCIKRRKQLKEM